jgi:hypothetical protein
MKVSRNASEKKSEFLSVIGEVVLHRNNSSAEEDGVTLETGLCKLLPLEK